MKKILALSVLALATSSATASECATTYMRGGAPSKFDPLAHKALDARYHLVDVDPTLQSYESPKPVAGSMPSAPTDDAGSPVHGYVLIAYVVNVAGRAESPTVVEASDDALAKAALGATGTWHFSPGKVNGEVACTAALQEFKF